MDPLLLGKAAIMGVVEGLTEFLPISSTAHLLIAGRLIGFQGSEGGSFEIAIQLGAVLAVVGYYARDLAAQARALPRDPLVRQFWLGIGVAFLPAAIVGLALYELIKAVLFTSPVVIARRSAFEMTFSITVIGMRCETPDRLSIRRSVRASKAMRSMTSAMKSGTRMGRCARSAHASCRVISIPRSTVSG